MGAIYDRNGKAVPITPIKGSWAEQERARREGRSAPAQPKPTGWPLGYTAKGEVR
ncbi:hypothetical protein D9M72_200190 [compost metagenome]